MDFAAFDQGQKAVISLVNKARTPFSQWQCGSSPGAFLAALQKYADLFASFWSTPCKLQFAADVSDQTWEVIFVDDATQAGALGYHDVAPDQKPRSLIFVKTSLQAGDSPSVTTAHELVEMLGDPAINLCAISPKGTVVAYETADACERETFKVDGIDMSDFVLPAYFEPFRRPSSTRFDYMQRVDRPFRILPGGYLPVYRNGQWGQVFGSDEARARRMLEDRRGHRSYHRGAKVCLGVASEV